MKALAALLAVVALAACSKSGISDSVPDLKLSTLQGYEASTRVCGTSKCVLAYVAPWCPHCRSSVPGILALRAKLWKQGIMLRVAVGMDKPQAVAEYAKVFGPDTLLDPDDKLAVGGVPHFYVTDAQGRVVKDVPGVPKDGASAEDLAAALGLD